MGQLRHDSHAASVGQALTLVEIQKKLLLRAGRTPQWSKKGGQHQESASVNPLHLRSPLCSRICSRCVRWNSERGGKLSHFPVQMVAWRPSKHPAPSFGRKISITWRLERSWTGVTARGGVLSVSIDRPHQPNKQIKTARRLTARTARARPTTHEANPMGELTL